ncbi:hypothetical protein CspeluHIS016_0600420 [Cutaneotrichosporon spelunceum]|uniref:Major facilitator superfamily (MFS) profile domain-containing protein n=1 Tax=Cutaneotrichosporon spelunceum TaxID=1672016 RepID=A0AAD3TY41_9TREE|nr:hypothetical protein CspeluHIS016_0600420 [Cutaneotrichosporon spelunceum]
MAGITLLAQIQLLSFFLITLVMPVHVYPPPGSTTTRDANRPRRRRNNTHAPHTLRGQLAGWHADREDGRSFLRAMIPSWKTERSADDVIYNPFRLLGMVKAMDWLYFISGWFAWTVDGFDFFTVTVTIEKLESYFDRSTTDIATSMTLTLMFRSLGALTFGILADRFGRKWTLVVNLLLIATFEFCTAFTSNYAGFLGVRALFGIVMGGVWGQAAATALENVPVPARGLLSGIMQGGYTLGYVLAAVANLALTDRYGWKSVFYCGGAISLLAAIIRAMLPESRQYILAREQLKAEGLSGGQTARIFLKELKLMLKVNWLRCLWGICLMTGFNFLAHGSQDLYPSYLRQTKGLTENHVSAATILASGGATIGSAFAGYLSQYAGRRLGAMIFLLWTAAWIPLWIIPNTFGALSAGGFLIQFGVFGTWGVVPIYLGEISPPAFRASFAGVTYQLGNMIASPAAQIQADAGNVMKTWGVNLTKGKWVPDYATVQGIVTGTVIVWLFLFLFLGPEADGSHFDQAKVAFQEGGGTAEPSEFVRADHGHFHAHDDNRVNLDLERGHGLTNPLAAHEKLPTDHSFAIKL